MKVFLRSSSVLRSSTGKFPNFLSFLLNLYLISYFFFLSIILFIFIAYFIKYTQTLYGFYIRISVLTGDEIGILKNGLRTFHLFFRESNF